MDFEDWKEKEPIDLKVMWRGVIDSIGECLPEEINSKVTSYIWRNGVFETDNDPLYVIGNGMLFTVLRPASERQYEVIREGEILSEVRVANIFSVSEKFAGSILMADGKAM